MVSRDASEGQKLQRAVALLQLLLNTGGTTFTEAEEEAREQLEEWGIKLPEYQP